MADEFGNIDNQTFKKLKKKLTTLSDDSLDVYTDLVETLKDTNDIFKIFEDVVVDKVATLKQVDISGLGSNTKEFTNLIKSLQSDIYTNISDFTKNNVKSSGSAKSPDDIYQMIKKQNPKMTDLLTKQYSTAMFDAIHQTQKLVDDSAQRQGDIIAKQFDESVFSRVDDVVQTKIGRLFGLDTLWDNFKGKQLDKISKTFSEKISKSINVGKLINGGGMAGGAESMANSFRILPVLLNPVVLILAAIGAAFIAIGFTIKQAFDYWKRFKETSLEIQKTVGVSSIEAQKLTKQIETAYFNTSLLNTSWEDVKDSVIALRIEFKSMTGITDELIKTSIKIQQVTGITADESAAYLDTMKNIYGLSEKQINNQLDFLANEQDKRQNIGYSVKEMVKLYSNTELVAKVGFKNLSNAYKDAKKLRLEVTDMVDALSGFELGNFEDSFANAGKLAQMGVFIDPLEIQLLQNAGKQGEAFAKIQQALIANGKDLNKLDLFEQKLLADSLGGQENLLIFRRAIQASKEKELLVEQKIAIIKEKTFDDLLSETQGLDKIGILMSTLKKSWEVILSKLAPAFEAIFKGFEAGLKPFLKAFKLVESQGGKLIPDDTLAKLGAVGERIGAIMGNLITNLPSYISRIETFINNLSNSPLIKILSFLTGGNSGDNTILEAVKTNSDAYIDRLHKASSGQPSLPSSIRETNVASINKNDTSISSNDPYGLRLTSNNNIDTSNDMKKLIEETKRGNDLKEREIQLRSPAVISISMDSNKIAEAQVRNAIGFRGN